MKKSLATLWLATSLALSWAPKANAQVDKNSDETQHQIENVFNQQQNVDSNDTISFEDAKSLAENQQLIEEIMNNEKMQELINKYWEEQVRQALEELLSSDKTENVIEYLLSDQKIQRALEEWDWDALSQRMLHILRFYYWVNTLGKLSMLILSTIFLIYSIRDLKWWHYVIGKRKK